MQILLFHSLEEYQRLYTRMWKNAHAQVMKEWVGIDRFQGNRFLISILRQLMTESI